MGNYLASLPAYKPGPGLNLEPINAALDGVIQQNDRNRQFGMQQQQIDAQNTERTYQHGRDAKQDALQQVQFYGKQATAVDQMQGPQRAAAWSTILAKHGTQGLSPEELDPVTGPKLMAAQAGQYLDPRDSQAKDLELQKTRAEIGKLNSEAANAGSTYGKAGTVVQGADGRFYSIQFGSGGQRKIEALEIGATTNGETPPVALAPQRGVDVVGDQMYDKATGKPVRNVGSNIAGGESAKVVGRETGEGQMNLPKARNQFEQSQIADENLNSVIDEAITNAASTSGFTGAAMSVIPGTAAHDQANRLATIKANIGFDKLQDMRNNSPTGGALGQVSEQENKLLQSTWRSVEQSQTPALLKENLTKIKAIRQRFQALRKQAYEADVKRFGKANVPSLDTGELPGASQPAAASGAPASPAPVRVSTPEEAMRLPSGTVFVTPDGRTKVRP